MSRCTLAMLWLLPLWAAVAPSVTAQQRIVGQHLGLDDPESEGFILKGVNGSPRFGPVTDDLGTEAWSIVTDPGETVFYTLRASPDETEWMLSRGWRLAIELRVVPPFVPPIAGPAASLQVGGGSFFLAFGAEADGSPIVFFQNKAYPLSPLGIRGAGYHRYELGYQAADQMATLWVDEVAVASVYSPDLDPRYGGSLIWGTVQSPSANTGAYWHEVTWAAVPEPSTWALFGLGLSWVVLTAHLPRQRSRRCGDEARIWCANRRGTITDAIRH